MKIDRKNDSLSVALLKKDEDVFYQFCNQKSLISHLMISEQILIFEAIRFRRTIFCSISLLVKIVSE
jgi:hypothetical protein